MHIVQGVTVVSSCDRGASLMSIFPLPVFEEDADPTRRDALTLEEQLAATEAPKTMVVRFGRMKMIGEYEVRSPIRAGCGSKIVVRTHRGIELATLLTTTCPNSGCPTSVSRKEMLDYIDASGGKDYPFYDRGRVLRIATGEDLHAYTEQAGQARQLSERARESARFFNLDMKIVDAEMTLEGERGVVYYHAEERVDFREMAQDLGAEFRCRIDMRQVGARDEARLVADYERCGQHCCCKNFLKVLKPVSMRSAKQQKATLDPLKISGRCGRLMCCLRYEDKTYKDLKSNLPHRKAHVGTIEGPGTVVDAQILTQLVRVKLDHDGREIAVAVEELMPPDECPEPGSIPPPPMTADEERIPEQKAKRKRRRRKGQPKGVDEATQAAAPESSGGAKKKRRRRRGKRDDAKPNPTAESSGSDNEISAQGSTKKKRRRRRGKRGGKKPPPTT